jgi:hypothetical protein
MEPGREMKGMKQVPPILTKLGENTSFRTEVDGMEYECVRDRPASCGNTPKTEL